MCTGQEAGLARCKHTAHSTPKKTRGQGRKTGRSGASNKDIRFLCLSTNSDFLTDISLQITIESLDFFEVEAMREGTKQGSRMEKAGVD